jgi:hypothetical protein
MTTRVVLTLVLISFLASPLLAQMGVGFGPQVGIYKSQDADGSSIMGGGTLRLKFSDVLGAEVSVNYREEKYANGFVTAKSWPVMVTGLLYPVPIVYGAIGAGWYNTSISYNFPPGFLGGPATITSETKQAFGWHFGGGLDLPAGSVVRIVGDIRYVFLDYDFKNVPGSGVNSNFYVITAGLLFNL